MDENSSLIPRERVNGREASLLTAYSPMTLDVLPRERALLDYLMILRKHKWLILSIFVSVVSIVTIATFRQQPIYQATARIEVDPENNKAVQFAGSGDAADEAYEDYSSYAETQSKILVSRTLAA